VAVGAAGGKEGLCVAEVSSRVSEWKRQAKGVGRKGMGDVGFVIGDKERGRAQGVRQGS